MRTREAIDDNQAQRGHVCECAGCGERGVFCDTDAGELIGSDGSPATVETNGLSVLMAGTTDGTRTDEVFCETCAENAAQFRRVVHTQEGFAVEQRDGSIAEFLSRSEAAEALGRLIRGDAEVSDFEWQSA